MNHGSRERLDLVNRTKKVVGQLEGVLRALNQDESCADVLQRLSAARGAIHSLMAELMEDPSERHAEHFKFRRPSRRRRHSDCSHVSKVSRAAAKRLAVWYWRRKGWWFALSETEEIHG